jgi:fatty acid desaturase
MGLIAALYLAWGTLVWNHAVIPWWVILPIGAYLAALHSSLQHEVLHGHPTRHRAVNEALVFVPLAIWLPYGRYRDTHLAHHNDQHLTDPAKDPESFYLLPDDWAAVRGVKRALFQFNQTLMGRMLIGPAVSIIRFWSEEWVEIFAGDKARLKAWIGFIAATAITITFAVWYCGMPLWKYIALISYPGISLALIRSYCEHQAVADLGERTISVEASPFWSLMFLNNNLHIAHHSRPSLAWYKLGPYYRAERAALLKKNNGYLMRGYGEIFRRYFFRPKEPIAYPDTSWLKP